VTTTSRDTAPAKRVVLPPLQEIDQAVRHLVACHDYVDAAGRPVYRPGDFPTVSPA
jgi:hypothetical protein